MQEAVPAVKMMPAPRPSDIISAYALAPAKNCASHGAHAAPADGCQVPPAPRACQNNSESTNGEARALKRTQLFFREKKTSELILKTSELIFKKKHFVVYPMFTKKGFTPYKTPTSFSHK